MQKQRSVLPRLRKLVDKMQENLAKNSLYIGFRYSRHFSTEWFDFAHGDDNVQRHCARALAEVKRNARKA